MKKAIFISAIAVVSITACSPTEYEVSREISIDAPATVVFEQVDNHQNRDAWSPWEKMDPQMKKSYEGPESGVGAIYNWSGNDSVGKGSLEILESNPNTYIKSQLTFVEPMEATSTIEWHFSEDNDVTLAKWVNKGSLPGYLFWMGQDDMDEMMGPAFEKGLAQLKAVSEEKAEETIPSSAVETTVEPVAYFYIEAQLNWDEMDMDFFSDNYDKLFGYLAEDAANVTAPPFAVYHEWDEENQTTTMEVGVASNSNKPAMGEIKKGMTYGGDVVMQSFYGPYEGTAEIHDELLGYIERSGLAIAGSPWESYVVGPGDDPDPKNWLTEIYYPVSYQDSANK